MGYLCDAQGARVVADIGRVKIEHVLIADLSDKQENSGGCGGRPCGARLVAPHDVSVQGVDDM